MMLTPDLLFAAAIAAVAFLLGVLRLRVRSSRTRSVGRRLADEPGELRFSCVGCSGRFTHSRRTLRAWGDGARRFYCNACHTRLQGANPPSESPSWWRR